VQQISINQYFVRKLTEVGIAHHLLPDQAFFPTMSGLPNVQVGDTSIELLNNGNFSTSLS